MQSIVITFPQEYLEVVESNLSVLQRNIGNNGKIDSIHIKTDSTDSGACGFAELRQKCCNLENAVREKDNIIKAFEEKTTQFMTVLSSFQQQHDQLAEEFTLLRSKYDDNKHSLVKLLWEVMPKNNPDLDSIPPLDPTIDESTETLKSFKILELIGEGQFAQVKKCVDNSNGDEFAVKMIKKDRVVSFKSIQRISNEISVMKSLSHPGIVRLIGVFHSRTSLNLVLEYCQHDLFSYFEANGDSIGEDEVKDIARGIMEPLMYIHQAGICHRDLKPENILLCSSSSSSSSRVWNKVKICDFGLCQVISTPAQAGKRLLDDFCGSPGFFAPEMILDSLYDGLKSDVWSLGCILLELTIGHGKFCDLWMGAYDYDNIMNKNVFRGGIETSILELSGYLRHHHHESGSSVMLSASLIDFLTAALTMKPNHRPSISSLLHHSWIGRDPNKPPSLMCDLSGSSSSSSPVLSPGLIILTTNDDDDGGEFKSPVKFQPHPPLAPLASPVGGSIDTKIKNGTPSSSNNRKLMSSNSKVTFCSSKSSDDLTGDAMNMEPLQLDRSTSSSSSKSPIKPFVSQRQRNAFEGQASQLHNRESVKFPPLEPTTPGLSNSRKRLQSDDF